MADLIISETSCFWTWTDVIIFYEGSPSFQTALKPAPVKRTDSPRRENLQKPQVSGRLLCPVICQYLLNFLDVIFAMPIALELELDIGILYLFHQFV